MDPISALSFAANIAQFVDLGASLVQKTREISTAGATVDMLHLISLSQDITNINTSLTTRQEGLLSQTVSPEEKALCDLAKSCTETATELSKCLLSISAESPGSVWPSVRVAMRTIWKKDRIDALAQRLGDFRAQLSIRILLVLNQHQQRQQQVLSNIGEDIRKEIVEVVAVTCEDLRAAIAEHQHETVSAILTNRDGGSTALTNMQAGSRLSKRLASTNAVATSITYVADQTNSKAKEKGSTEEEVYYKPITTRDVADYDGRVLDSLHFRGIRERHLSIRPEHTRTFEWAWKQPEDDLSWPPLSDWLAAETTSTGSCYWISGKAGSGKSSLMKYLQNDRRTMACLQEWAGSTDIVVASFYFWYAGTPLQQSQDGLLRSVLFDIFSERPYLIPTIFPDICRSIISGKLPGNIEFSRIELQTAFANLIRTIPSDLRVFLFIDGVDEYTGDTNEICDLLSEAAQEPSIKALISSRPIPACVHRFETFPRLRLQDLTRNDIQLYVSDHLCKHSLLRNMELTEPGITNSLIDLIVSRASGVFLWVVLVVRNIQVGLQDYRYDSASNLAEEIDKLPPDLEKLYIHMLGNMSHENRVSASKLFQVALRDFELQTAYPPSILQLSFCESENYTECLGAPVKELDEAFCRLRCERTEGRLRSRCCGLIEVGTSPPRSVPGCERVSFLHRTVVEFLQLDFVWDKIVLMTSDTSFNADLALMSSSVAELKAVGASHNPFQGWSHIQTRMTRMVSYEKRLDGSSKKAFHETYLPAARDALGHRSHDPSIFGSPEEEMSAINSSSKRGCERLGLEFPHSLFLSLSLQEPTLEIVGDLFEELDLDQESWPLTLLSFVMHFTEETQSRLRLAMSKFISFDGATDVKIVFVKNTRMRTLWTSRWKNASENQVMSGWTIGQFIVRYCYSIMNDPEVEKFDFADERMVESLLRIIAKVLADDGHLGSSIAIPPKTVPTYSIIRALLRKIPQHMHATSGHSGNEIPGILSVIEAN